MELDIWDCFLIARKPRRREELQPPLSDGLTHRMDYPRPPSMVWIARKIILSAHSQTFISVYSAWHGTAAQQSFTSLYKKTSTILANGVPCVKQNVTFWILVANMRDHVQKLAKNQKVVTVMAHLPRTTSTAICNAELLGLTAEASQKIPEPQSALWSGEEKAFVQNLDSAHVPERRKRRLWRILRKFDKMWDGHHGEIIASSHRTNLKPEARPVKQWPYRTKPKPREFVSEEVDQICETNITEPGTAK